MTAAGVDVLLAEDDEDVREAMTDTLEGAGYRIAAVPNGEEALEWLRSAERPPTLILLDLMMPVMNGWEFRAAQLADAGLASIPVAVLSARRDGLDRAVEQLNKPIQAKLLLSVVARYCGARPLP